MNYMGCIVLSIESMKPVNYSFYPSSSSFIELVSSILSDISFRKSWFTSFALLGLLIGLTLSNFFNIFSTYSFDFWMDTSIRSSKLTDLVSAFEHSRTWLFFSVYFCIKLSIIDGFTIEAILSAHEVVIYFPSSILLCISVQSFYIVLFFNIRTFSASSVFTYLLDSFKSLLFSLNWLTNLLMFPMIDFFTFWIDSSLSTNVDSAV